MIEKIKFYEMIKNLGFNPKVSIDCGAAWGEWSGQIKSVFPESYIIGIDANNWSNSSIPNTDLTIIDVLSDVDGKEMTFYRKKENLESGSFCTGDSLFRENSHHYGEHNTVKNIIKTRTLKSILNENNINKIDLLKIDTQGSEILIMEGLGDYLKNIEFIELECSIIEYNLGGCSFLDVQNFLSDNFEMFDIVSALRINGQFLGQIDVIFKNKNSTIKVI